MFSCRRFRLRKAQNRTMRIVHRTNHARIFFRSLFVVILAFLSMLNRTALGQLGTTEITGVITDLTGARIALALVTVKNNATTQTRETQSTVTGIYRFPSLTPAVYELRVFIPGFNEEVISNISARVGETITVNATLRPAAVSETVDVQASALGMDTATSQVAGFISTQTVDYLPLNGRNFIDLAFLLPGNAPAPN